MPNGEELRRKVIQTLRNSENFSPIIVEKIATCPHCKRRFSVPIFLEIGLYCREKEIKTHG